EVPRRAGAVVLDRGRPLRQLHGRDAAQRAKRPEEGIARHSGSNESLAAAGLFFFRTIEEVSVKRRSFLKNAGLALAAGTASAAPGIVSAQAPAVYWRMALSWPKSLDTLYGGMEFLANRV